MSNDLIEQLTIPKNKKDYAGFERVVNKIKAAYMTYLDSLDVIIGIIEEIFYCYKSEGCKTQNRLKEDYEVIFSDDIEFFFGKYVAHIGEERLLTSKQGLQLLISVANVFTLSYKIKEYTRLMQKVVDSSLVTDFETKKYALSALLAPDCWMYLTKGEWERYIHINDTQPYGQELNEAIRNFTQLHKKDDG